MDMKEKNIIKIEDLLKRIKASKNPTQDGLVRQYFEVLCNWLGSPASRSPQKIAFDRNLPAQHKKFVAVCLLRLLCANENAVWEPLQFRSKVFALLDEQFGEIYATFGIQKNDNNHEKLSKLRDTETKLFGDFENIINSIVSLQTAVDIRNRLMKSLHNPINVLLLEHFVDPSILSSERIKEFFSAINQYKEASSLSKLEPHDNFVSVYKALLRDAERMDSQITINCVTKLLRKINDVIEYDFSSNEVIKEARVEIHESEYKYPFHIENKKISIKIELENLGPGYAFNTLVEMTDFDDNLEIINPSIFIGSLRPGRSTIAFETIVKKCIDYKPSLIGYFSWNSHSKPTIKQDFIFELTPQRSNLDWKKLKTSKPYSLEAVVTEEELVGRDELIQRLLAKVSSSQIESTIIYGQKRVGKTSIAKTLQSKLKKQSNYSVIYIGVGSLDKLSSIKFVSSIGSEIVYEINYDPELARLGIEEPQFDGALAPLIHFFKDIKRVKLENKFLIIIDEFDEIPSELFNYTPIGDTFFHNIRSLSSNNFLGFVLVGGENMHIIQQSTDRLNKFEAFRVDYFDKEKYWDDFQELVRRPVTSSLEFSDEAIVRLYDMTEGNPFFTKLICIKIFERACDTRNSYISPDEVQFAINSCMDSLTMNNINHFWKDGILEDEPARIDIIETQRRKFLIAFAEIKRERNVARIDDLISSPVLEDVSTKEILESFISRGVLVASHDSLRIKPQFFEKWLIEKGHYTMTKAFLDEEAITAMERKEGEAYVGDIEIYELSESWGLYRGSPITETRIREWLNQFANNIERRHMFILLQNLRFYDELKIREKLRVIHESARKGILREIKGTERSQHDILLSSFGSLSESGPSLTRMYRADGPQRED
ncbi:MAG: ATP-binding protein [bacterium]